MKAPLYRVHVLAPMPYVDTIRREFGPEGQKRLLEDVADRIRRLGFEVPELVMQDPTDNTRFRVLARWKPSPAASRRDALLSVTAVEPLLEPRESPKVTNEDLDPELAGDEVLAVRQALDREHNPQHLEGFAGTLEPSFPVAATLLRARMVLLENVAHTDAADVLRTGRAGLRALRSEERKALDAARAGIEAYAMRRGLPLDLVREETRRTACMLSDGRPLDVAPELAALALLLLRPLGDPKWNLRVVDRTSVAVTCPYDGHLSPSAVQLALARGKPEMSGVTDRGQIALVDRRMNDVRTPTERILSLQAQSQMERAHRALERRRWAEWYRKRREQG